ncbi:MAG: N-acetyl-gamma-glutamyl-phosphate reductase [bacterium]
MSTDNIRVSILGATGYGGVELLRWLLPHPNVTITAVSSESSAGMPLEAVHPQLTGMGLTLSHACDAQAIGDPQVVFFALPNGETMKIAPQLVERGVKVIDLGADFRLKNQSVYEKFYKMQHTCPKLLSEAVYGLPELYRDEIINAQIIGNPGCYPTSILLATVPLLKAKVIKPTGIIADSKSGVSGAGRTALKTPYLYAEANEDFCAYGIGTHRHTPEIEQQMTGVGVGEAVITFTPHLVPMTRGIHSTIYAELAKDLTAADLIEILTETYKDSPFVKVLDENHLPHTKWCSGSNNAFITARVDERTGRAVLCSAIDNLGKGMASQAIQNMNLMFGLDETAGLNRVSVFP